MVVRMGITYHTISTGNSSIDGNDSSVALSNDATLTVNATQNEIKTIALAIANTYDVQLQSVNLSDF